mmetsp:Transcript_32304/g.84766  ORF Transcript_32304/g.84766 Transcript_32304/m.84766 type:complete len:229 (+) Transcript_32304:52-738(+)
MMVTWADFTHKLGCPPPSSPPTSPAEATQLPRRPLRPARRWGPAPSCPPPAAAACRWRPSAAPPAGSPRRPPGPACTRGPRPSPCPRRRHPPGAACTASPWRPAPATCRSPVARKPAFPWPARHPGPSHYSSSCPSPSWLCYHRLCPNRLCRRPHPARPHHRWNPIPRGRCRATSSTARSHSTCRSSAVHWRLRWQSARRRSQARDRRTSPSAHRTCSRRRCTTPRSQ